MICKQNLGVEIGFSDISKIIHVFLQSVWWGFTKKKKKK